MATTDWNDPKYWDEQYNWWARRNWIECFDIWHGLNIHFAASCVEAGRHRVWVPGNGLSLAPFLLAACGLEVWASDFSSRAVGILHKAVGHPALARVVAGRLAEFPGARLDRPGIIHVVQHDFRTPWTEGTVDAVFNTAAFQGLTLEGMLAAARVFHAALRPGGSASFRLCNPSDELWERIGHSLAEAGFDAPSGTDGEPRYSDLSFVTG